MAKLQGNMTEQGEVEVQIVNFRLKGATPAMIEGLKGIANVFANGSRAATPRMLKNAAPSPPVATPANEMDDESAIDSDIIEQDESPETVAAGSRRPGVTRKPRQVRLNEAIDFSSATMPIKDFVEQFDLSNNMRRYTAIAVWFKEHLGMPELTVNDIYTAYRHLGWTNLPRNPAQPLADLTNQQDYRYFVAGTKRGQYKIHFIGEQELEKWRNS